VRPDPAELRKRYSLMSKEEFAALKRGDLVEAAQQVYDEEAALRKQSEPEDSSASLPSIVKLTTHLEYDNTIRFGWPRGCACCDASQVATYLQTTTTFELKPLTFLESLGRSLNRRPDKVTLPWTIPVCASCYQAGQTEFFSVRSVPQVVSVGVATDLLHTPLLKQAPQRVERRYALNSFLTFANKMFSARFKSANTPEVTCSNCNHKVLSPYRRCLDCGTRDPVSWISWEAISASACYVCNGCFKELGDDAKHSPHCGLTQPSRALHEATG
jgi:hypothetical protein